jgi:hypothetical protein
MGSDGAVLIEIPMGPLWGRALTRPGRRSRVRADLTSRVVPGPEGATLCSPTHVALPGKRGAPGNGGSPRTQRGAGGGTLLRPQSNPRGLGARWLDVGRPGQVWPSAHAGRQAAGSESGVGGLVPSLTAGDRGNAEPDRRCPTGPALRPVKEHGVSVAGKPARLERELPASRGRLEGGAQGRRPSG